MPPIDTATEATLSRSSPDDDRGRVVVHMPVDVRSVSLGVLALLASLLALQWAKEVLIPILLGVMLSYALTPVVSQLHRFRVPRAAGATVVLSTILVALSWGVWSLNDQVDALVDTLPRVASKVREIVRRNDGTPSTIGKVERAAAEIEAAATASSEPAASGAEGARAGAASGAGAHASSLPRQAVQASSPARADAPANPSRPRIDIRGYVLSGTLGALALLGQIAVVFFIALFLLASGSTFRRKMVKLAGPRFSQKKVTVETLDEIAEQIQRYLLVQVGVSVFVGMATGAAFYALGLDQAAVWGVVAGIMNLIPYVGAMLVGAASALVAFVQFGTLDMALLIGGSSFAIHTLIGNVLTPWWTGRASRMSPFAVFVAVLLFGWLWGVWGLLLGVPIVMVVKSICDRVEDLKPIGELLGE